MIRDNKAKLNYRIQLASRLLNMISQFFIYRQLLSVLGYMNFGIWLTLYSFFSLMFIFDLGFSSGLKLNLTIAFSKQHHNEIKKIISNNYILLFAVLFVGLLLFFIMHNIFDLIHIINVNPKEVEIIRPVFIFLIISFFILFVSRSISDILSALQISFIDELVKLISNLITIIFLFYFSINGIKVEIFLISELVLLPPIFIYSLISFYFFFIKAPFLKVAFKDFDRGFSSSLLRINSKFFIIQLCSLILYSTDSLIISNLISSEAVVYYNTSYRIFSLPFLFFSVFISSHWTPFVDAFAKSDFNWIRKKLRIFKYLFLVLCTIYFIVFIFFDNIVFVWLGESDYNYFMINIFMCAFFLISSYTTIYIYVINASGSLFLQVLLYVIIAIVNIPLSIFMVKYFKLGSSGVILASSICLILLLFFIPIQVKKILNRTANGIFLR